MRNDNGRYAFLEDFGCTQVGYTTPPVAQSFIYSPVYSFTNPLASSNYYGSCSGCKGGSKVLSSVDAYSNVPISPCGGRTVSPLASPPRGRSISPSRASSDVEGLSIAANMRGRCNRSIAGPFANSREGREGMETFVPDPNSNFDSCRRGIAPQLTLGLSPPKSPRDRACQSCDGQCPNGYGCTKFVSAFDDCQGCSEGMVTYCNVTKPVEYGGCYGNRPNLRNVSPGVRASCNCGRCNVAGCNRHFV